VFHFFNGELTKQASSGSLRPLLLGPGENLQLSAAGCGSCLHLAFTHLRQSKTCGVEPSPFDIDELLFRPSSYLGTETAWWLAANERCTRSYQQVRRVQGALLALRDSVEGPTQIEFMSFHTWDMPGRSNSVRIHLQAAGDSSCQFRLNGQKVLRGPVVSLVPYSKTVRRTFHPGADPDLVSGALHTTFDDIGYVELAAHIKKTANSLRQFGCNKRGPGAQKRIIDGVATFGVI
jgi:hypothetical protein